MVAIEPISELWDSALLAEIELLGDLMEAAAQTSDHLSEPKIDHALRIGYAAGCPDAAGCPHAAGSVPARRDGVWVATTSAHPHDPGFDRWAALKAVTPPCD